MRASWRRLLAAATGTTPPVMLLVLATGTVIGVQTVNMPNIVNFLWQVFVISLPVLAIRALMRRQPVTVAQTRTIIGPPLPAAEATFRRRLSARRRSAQLIAFEAYDHYVRVHTDDGTELVTLRFADAIAELAGAHGLRVHRSWWVAVDAIQTVRWWRGAGEVQLAGDLTAPVSWNHATILKAASWF